MTKTEKIRVLLASGEGQKIYDLLYGCSPYSCKRPPGYKAPRFSTEVMKLIAVAKDHLYVLSKTGRGEGRIVEKGIYYFARPEKFEEWVNQGAPGVTEREVDDLYCAIETRQQKKQD